MLTSLRPLIIRTLGGDYRLTAVLRGSALVMAIQVLGIALTYSMQVVIARFAGPFEFGVFAYAWTWINVLFLVAAFGLNELALRLMPSYSARGEWLLLRGFVVAGPVMVFGLAGLAGLAAVGALLLLGDRVGDHYRLPLLLTFAATPLFGLLAFMQGVGRALGSVLAAFLPRFIGLPGFVMLAVGGFAVVGRIPGAVQIITATVAAAGVLVLVQATLLRRALPDEARHALVGIALMVGATVGWLWNQRLNESAETATVDPQEHGATMIVLPFEALSAAADDQFLAVGLAQQLISDLMPFAGLKLYSAPASSRQRPSADPTDIGRALSVAYVVRGSVRSGPGTVRVSVQLVDAKTGEVLWSETYDRPLTPDDLLDVQADLAAQIATCLGPASTTISSGRR